jgi:hypothetical protein
VKSMRPLYEYRMQEMRKRNCSSVPAGGIIVVA